MLRSQPIEAIPANTARIATPAFRKGTTVMRLRDAFGALFNDEDFTALFPATGQPALAPWRLALVTVFQFLENLIDRQVVDVLLREKRDLKSAEAFFEQAIKRSGVVPDEVVTDKHRAYLRAVKQHAPKAKHRRTGLHRKRALTTKPIERSHIPIKDRLRPMRGLGSVATGQRLLEGVELARAVQRGDVRPPHQCTPSSVHECSRLEVATFSWLASSLRTAA